jgi:hypothetical protein
MIVACGAFYAVVFLCIARQVLLADFFYTRVATQNPPPVAT